MKTNQQKQTVAIILAVIMMCPLVSFAQTPKQPREPKLGTGENFCIIIEKRQGETIKKWDEKVLTFKNNQQKRASDRIVKRGDRDAERTEKRTTQLEKKEVRFETLEQQATTAEQKAAVAEFTATIQSAIEKRKAAIDTAITEFRSGIDAIHTDRVGTVDTAIKNFTDTANQALSKAKTDCASGTDPKQVRTTYQSSIASIRESLQTTKKDHKPEIQKLIDERKESVQQAVTEFTTTVESAREKLAKVFPKGE